MEGSGLNRGRQRQRAYNRNEKLHIRSNFLILIFSYFTRPCSAQSPRGTTLRSASACAFGFVVDVVNADPLAVTICPFEVVQQAPQEIAFDRETFRCGALQMRQVVAQVHHAVSALQCRPSGVSTSADEQPFSVIKTPRGFQISHTLRTAQ